MADDEVQSFREKLRQLREVFDTKLDHRTIEKVLQDEAQMVRERAHDADEDANNRSRTR